MADPVLTATLSGRKAILLTWTFDSNADFQVFWKSSIPADQEYVLLATTNAFSYTTADLESNKIYYFYIRANVGTNYYYSNIVELFVSCGKGVVLETPPPPMPPQIPPEYAYAYHYWGESGPALTKVGLGVPLADPVAILGRTKLVDVGIPTNHQAMGWAQHPTDKTTFYFLEEVSPYGSYKLWKLVWPTTLTLVKDLTVGDLNLYGPLKTYLSAVAVNPATGDLHYCITFNWHYQGFYYFSRLVDVNITDQTLTYTAYESFDRWAVNRLFSFVTGGQLYFCIAGDLGDTMSAGVNGMRKTADSSARLFTNLTVGARGQGILFEDAANGQYLSDDSVLHTVDYSGGSITKVNRTSNNPSYGFMYTGIPIRTYAIGDMRYFFYHTDPENQFFNVFNIATGAQDSFQVCSAFGDNNVEANGAFAMKARSTYYRIIYANGEDTSIVRGRNLYVSGGVSLGGELTGKVDANHPQTDVHAFIQDIFVA